jgi:hypothetical protein
MIVFLVTQTIKQTYKTKRKKKGIPRLKGRYYQQVTDLLSTTGISCYNILFNASFTRSLFRRDMGTFVRSFIKSAPPSSFSRLFTKWILVRCDWWVRTKLCVAVTQQTFSKFCNPVFF